MRVLFVTNGGVSDPSSRVRVYQFLPAFRKELGRMIVAPLQSRFRPLVRLKQASILLLARWCDAVVIQKTASAKLIRALVKANPRVIWDIDDGVLLSFPQAKEALHLFERVVAGNADLAEEVRPFNPNVTVIPSVVDENRFGLADAKPAAPVGSPVVIGWVGHASNLRYLEPLRGAFESLWAKHPGRFTLKVVSSEPLIWPGVGAVQNKLWRLEEEAADVRSFDVGIMPLADDAWSRQKCGYKALLYMSQGVPPVVSPVGVNASIIEDGVDGFHAGGPDEWAAKLGRLIEDADLRRSIGAAGRRKVKGAYTIRAVLPLWRAVLEGTAPRVSPAGPIAPEDAPASTSSPTASASPPTASPSPPEAAAALRP